MSNVVDNAGILDKTTKRPRKRAANNIDENINPKKKIFFNPYLVEIRKLQKTISSWGNIYGINYDNVFSEDYIRLKILGEPLVEKYSWAIPDNQALKILNNFSPLIEIGCGKGYWASLLQKLGTDIIAYDKYLNEEDKSWTQVIHHYKLLLFPTTDKIKNVLD